MPQNVNDRWAAHKMLYNMYGPTEATCGATIKQLLPNQPVTIGIPNPSTRIYILNKRQKLVPLGVIGEICLAGIQVSEGYIGRPVETAERFVSDPICSEFGDRMYKTGDHGYWNQEGEIICLGRIDRQVKLRGFRIDLNHIECQMRRAASDVDTLAVAQKKDFLVAMIQPSSVDVPVFRAKIAKVLPVHALPRYVTAVDALPLTLTGKVDYEKVANSELPSGSPNVKLLASSSTQRIVGVWRDILNLAPYIPIDAESDFLDLGGNSIKQMLLSIRLSAYLGHQIPLRVVVESPTLSDLVKAIEGLDSIPDSTEKEQSLHEHELSSIEKDWWHKYEMGLGSSAFNVSFVCKLGSSIDLSKLTLSWNTILARHKILSGRYTLRRRLGVTKIFPPSPPQVARVNQIDIWQEVNRPFDLRKESPIGVTISASHMAVRISHIICDLTSLRQLLHEVTSVYHGSSLAPIEKTYPSRMVEGSIILPSNLEFWTECLSNLPSQQQYGTIKPQARTSYRGTSAICKLPPTLFHAMIDFAAKQKVTFHQMSLAAVAIALQHGPESLDIILGAPYLNRKCENDMQTIGLFLEPLPTRIRHSTATQSSSDRSSNADLRPESQSFVHAVQRSSQAALSHAMPWTQLLEHLKVTPDFPDHPLFDVMVTFHDERYETSLPISGCEPLYTWAQGAKFKLMTEFVAVSQDSLLLRVEYDTECFERRDVEVLQRLLAGALRSLVEQDNYNEMKERMKELEHGDNGEDELERMKESETFGFELKKL